MTSSYKLNSSESPATRPTTRHDPAASHIRRQTAARVRARGTPVAVFGVLDEGAQRRVVGEARHDPLTVFIIYWYQTGILYTVHAGFSSDRAWVHCGGDEKQRAPEFLILLALVWYGGVRKWYGCGLIYSPPRLTPNPTKALPRVRDSLAPHLRADGASGAQLRMCDGEGGGQRTQGGDSGRADTGVCGAGRGGG